jgi:hypothetical protein
MKQKEIHWVEKNIVLVVVAKRSLYTTMGRRNVKYVNTNGNIERKEKQQRRVESDFDKNESIRS